jgi:uncharacterized protein (DUF433 family)
MGISTSVCPIPGDSTGLGAFKTHDGGSSDIIHLMHPISSDPEILGGTPCFTGTRVPIKNLFDALAHGRSLDYFLEQFPTVTRQQALAVLELARQKLLHPAPAA